MASKVPKLNHDKRPQNQPREVGEKVQTIQDMNRYMIAEMKITTALPDVCIDDTEEIQRRVWSYLDRCEQWGKYPTVTGIACGIGIDRVTFYAWLSKKPEHPTAKFLRKMQTYVSNGMEQNLQNGSTNVIGTIFLLKSTCGYKEENQTTVVHKSELGDIKSAKEIEAEIDGTIIDVEFDEKV